MYNRAVYHSASVFWYETKKFRRVSSAYSTTCQAQSSRLVRFPDHVFELSNPLTEEARFRRIFIHICEASKFFPSNFIDLWKWFELDSKLCNEDTSWNFCPRNSIFYLVIQKTTYDLHQSCSEPQTVQVRWPQIFDSSQFLSGKNFFLKLLAALLEEQLRCKSLGSIGVDSFCTTNYSKTSL